MLNGIFLAGAGLIGPFRDEPFRDLLILTGLGVTLAASLVGFYLSKVDPFRKQFAERLGRDLEISGRFVEVRYYRSELELGRDVGWLGYDGPALRFEGVRSRFSTVQIGFVTFPDLVLRPRELVIDANGIPISIEINAKSGTQDDDIETILRRWPAEGTRRGALRMPPTTPDIRTRGWYWQRAGESATYVGGLVCLSFLLKSLVPQSIPWLRYLALLLPYLLFAIWLGRRARTLRLRDEELMAEIVNAEPSRLDQSANEIPQSLESVLHNR